MEFVFTGFRQVDCVRFYTYQGIADDRSRSPFSVETDVRLLRRYSISLQDMPLVCRRFLEAQNTPDSQSEIQFAEEDMRQYAGARLALLELAASKRKPHRSPVSTQSSQAWRGVRPQSATVPIA